MPSLCLSKLNKTQRNVKWMLCGDRDETINPISRCSKLERNVYKTGHDWGGWNRSTRNLQEIAICPNWSSNAGQKTKPSDCLKKRTSQIVDFRILVMHRVKIKENKKGPKYLDLARKLKKLWSHKVTVIRVISDTRRTVNKVGNGARRVGIQRKNRYHQSYRIVKIYRRTENCNH